MIILFIIYLLITLFALELFIVSKDYSREQRLLPLALGLVCLYMFYLIVEEITGARDIFIVLKYLLLMQVSYLMFYYILDFCQISLPIWVNVIFFSALGGTDILLCTNMGSMSLIKTVVLSICMVILILMITIATFELVKRSKRKHIHSVYKLLYMSLFFPFVALLMIVFFRTEESIVMPVALIGFVLIVIYLMLTGQFFETSQYVMEDLFKNVDEVLFIFDPDFCFIAATNSARNEFSELVSEMEASRIEFPQRVKMVEWASRGAKVFNYSYLGKYYRITITEVKRNDRLNGYIVAAADITSEMSQIESAHEQTRLKSEFLANMSHELRNPLHAIISGSELVLDNEEMSVKNRLMINNIRNAGNSLLDIVNSILDYSKIEAGKVKLNVSEYNLKEILERLTFNSLVELKNKEVDFRVVVDSPLPKKLLGDRNRVRIVIQNLINNAIKYTHKGSIECRITVETGKEENSAKLIILVEDTGIGMTTEEADNAFNRYTTYGNEVSESTGIGLYVVKEMCELMSGSISVESAKGTGSTFVATIIQNIADSDTFGPFILDKNNLGATKREATKKLMVNHIYPEAAVLVVDDMKVNREIFAGKVKPWKINIDEAANGPEAIQKVKSGRYDIIIMDQMMPGMNGLETTDEIRKFSDTPVVMLTADISDNMIKKCEEHNLNGYLAKPLSLERLEEIFEKYISEDKKIKAAISEDELVSTAISTDDPMYNIILDSFAEEILEISQNIHAYFTEDIELFRVKVHGIKGIARQLNRNIIADEAEIFEMAAKSSHIDFIRRHIDGFIIDLNIEVENAKAELASRM